MGSGYLPHTTRLKRVDKYVRELFRDELPAGIKYHNADHTLHATKGVVAVANNLAKLENVSELDRELIIAAAYFHDTGYIREYEKNEPIAARMAGRILKLIGYKPDEIKKVQKMILATDPDVEPKTHVEKILCDADLDNLGREDFFQLDERLREGRGMRGIDVSDDVTWYRNTLEFLEEHQYYTESQNRLREKGKQKNTRELIKKLESLKK
jgi:predicted metal-dependent HD superfamily phosphohydrolase